MKHFFYSYNEMKCEHGILNRLFDDYFNESEDMGECLKVLYDVADIIRDIRFGKDEKNIKVIFRSERNSGLEIPRGY